MLREMLLFTTQYIHTGKLYQITSYYQLFPSANIAYQYDGSDNTYTALRSLIFVVAIYI